MTSQHSSRLKSFYKLSPRERRSKLAAWAALDESEQQALDGGLTLAAADLMVENTVGLYDLPLAVAANFIVNDQDRLLPMVIEEPSVVAAMSNAARLARAGGGFRTGSTEPVMIGQIQLLDVPDMDAAALAIDGEKQALLAGLEDLHPTIHRLGGGVRDLEIRQLRSTPAGPMLVVHILMDTRDAMGANAVNTTCESLSPELERLSGGRALLRILSNLSDRRRAWASCKIPLTVFEGDRWSGAEVAQGIVEANAFAWADPYRAATHNKGIMNGIDAIALATGQDWRAIEAGAHAYAARDGQYRALTSWLVEGQALVGKLEMPLAVGTVGGLTRIHPTARLALKILGQPDARTLAEVMVAGGLAQNLAALRALVAEGIQQGHMALHARKQQP